MAKNIDIYESFGGCTTHQEVLLRLKAMDYREIRELLSGFGCSIDRLDIEVCRSLCIKVNKQCA